MGLPLLVDLPLLFASFACSSFSELENLNIGSDEQAMASLCCSPASSS